MFTKGLTRDQFELLRQKLGLTEIPGCFEVKSSARMLKDSEFKLKGSVEVLNN